MRILSPGFLTDARYLNHIDTIEIAQLQVKLHKRQLQDLQFTMQCVVLLLFRGLNSLKWELHATPMQ